MKKIILIILTILILTNLGRKSQTPTKNPEVIEYHKGTEGLSIELIKGLPPDKILEGSNFVVGIELKNKGAADIDNGKISIYGFESGYTKIINPDISFNMEGKKPGFPEGTIKIINFEINNIAMPEIIDEYNAPFIIRTYYKYTTEASTEICINPHIGPIDMHGGWKMKCSILPCPTIHCHE